MNGIAVSIEDVPAAVVVLLLSLSPSQLHAKTNVHKDKEDVCLCVHSEE